MSIQVDSVRIDGLSVGVERFSLEAQSKGAVHESALGDSGWIERQGRFTRKVSLSGYLLQPRLLEKYQQLLLSLQKEGSLLLEHPTYGGMRAFVSEYSVSDSLLERGIIHFSAAFNELSAEAVQSDSEDGGGSGGGPLSVRSPLPMVQLLKFNPLDSSASGSGDSNGSWGASEGGSSEIQDSGSPAGLSSAALISGLSSPLCELVRRLCSGSEASALVRLSEDALRLEAALSHSLVSRVSSLYSSLFEGLLEAITLGSSPTFGRLHPFAVEAFWDLLIEGISTSFAARSSGLDSGGSGLLFSQLRGLCALLKYGGEAFVFTKGELLNRYAVLSSYLSPVKTPIHPAFFDGLRVLLLDAKASVESATSNTLRINAQGQHAPFILALQNNLSYERFLRLNRACDPLVTEGGYDVEIR